MTLLHSDAIKQVLRYIELARIKQCTFDDTVYVHYNYPINQIVICPLIKMLLLFMQANEVGLY